MDDIRNLDIENRLSILETKLEYIRISQDKILEKVESLSSFRYGLVGACTVVSGIVGFLASFLGIR